MVHTAFDNDEKYLFHRGSNACAYRFMGAHPLIKDGRRGYVFRLWAPGAQSVDVVGDFCQWKAGANPMDRLDNGMWELFLPGIKQYDAYKYLIKGAKGRVVLKADPYAFHSETRPGTASKAYNISGYKWGDGAWMRKRAKYDPLRSPVNIYEMHLGSWRRDEQGRMYTYQRVADELIPYLTDMGYTHVQFMPVTEYPLDMSWGYQVTGFFAPTSRYGEPHDFMSLIDRLHRAGIGMLMDWVPAHFPKDEFGLRRFDGTALYEAEDSRLGDNPQWGTHVFNYKRDEVRSFLLSSARFWLSEYHIDGLRVDAVSYMLYLNYGRSGGQWKPNEYGGNENIAAIDFLRELNTIVYKDCPGVMMTAEEATSFPMVTRPCYIGGLGFGFKWNMGWMNDILSYLKRDPVYRSYHHNALTFSLMYAFSENYVLALSHDEVVHGKKSLLDKAPGDYWQKFATLRLLYGYQYSHPGKKLVFMGGEFGQFIEWKYDDQLDWFLLEYDSHRGMQAYVRDINRLYRETPALYEVDDSWDGFKWLSVNDAANSVLAFMRIARNGDSVICVHNFTPQYMSSYRIGLPAAGTLRLVLCSDEGKYGGSGKCVSPEIVSKSERLYDFTDCFDIELAPLASAFFRYERSAPAAVTDTDTDKEVSRQ